MTTITLEATSFQGLQNQVGNLALPPGSSGRFTLVGRELAGFCVPIGTALTLPWVGERIAQYLAGVGVTVTSQGKITTCKGFINWKVPAGAPQGQVRMGIVVLAIGLVIALGGAAAAIGWAISQITAFFRVVDPTTPTGFLVWAALAVVAFITLLPRGRRAT